MDVEHFQQFLNFLEIEYANQEQFFAYFATLDRDNDGFITFDDFKEFITQNQDEQEEDENEMDFADPLGEDPSGLDDAREFNEFDIG